jgi:uncharacterized protein (TIGR02421 family)
MSKALIRDFSTRLKEIARDLIFLGHPRYPLQTLHRYFPQHHAFIHELEDVSVPFGIDADAKRKAMDQLHEDLEKSELELPLKQIFQLRLSDYRILLSMMENFGSAFFYDRCCQLYGSSQTFPKEEPFLRFLEKIPDFCVPEIQQEKLRGEAALSYLRQRMLETFVDTEVDVRPSTSLLSDSSAGRKVLKLNPNKAYSPQALEIFLVHEGWVHLGTSLNGAAQSEHPWLATWAPRTTFLQEGLAILTEIITGNMTHDRWNKVMLRHHATSMAERGAPIQDVYTFLCHHQMEKLDAFKLALRVFRGIPLEGGMAFTKELLYLHGLVQLLYHLQFYQFNLRSLWIGKLSFNEHLLLKESSENGSNQLRYFPIELDDPLVQQRLVKLQRLVIDFFPHGLIE